MHGGGRFHGISLLLRTTEPLKVTAGDVTWTARRGSLSLPLTKVQSKGIDAEIVTVEDLVVLRLLPHVLEGSARGALMFQGGAGEFQKLWKSHLARLGLLGDVCQPYSPKESGATQLFVEFGQLASTQHRKRWGSYKTCRVQVVEGRRNSSSNTGYNRHSSPHALRAGASRLHANLG